MRLILLIGLLVVGDTFASDFVMVWKKDTSLYNEQGRNMLSISQGEIVEAVIHPKDNSLYMVKYKGSKYNSPIAAFKSLEDMAAYYKKRLIDLDGLEKEHALKISTKSSELDLMYIKALELRRDTAVAYKKVTSNNGSTYIGYSSSLSEGKYKKLMKEWEGSYNALSDDFRKSHITTRSLIQEKDKIKEQLSNLDNLVKAFSRGKKLSHKTLFVIAAKGAKLFKENKLVKHMAYGDSALGTEDTNHPGWFKILVDKKVYLVSGKEVAEKGKYLSSIKLKQSSAKYEISYLNKQVEKLQFRLKLVNGISRQLEADKFVAGGYGVVKNYVIPIDNNRTFTLESPDATRLYINSVRAEKILREWKQEALKLSGDSLNMQKRVIYLQKSLVDFEKKIQTLTLPES